MNKKCSTCKVVKDLSEFGNNSRMRDGHAYTCRSCVSISSKSYRERNKEKLRVRKKLWRLNNIEKERERKKKYLEENREKIYDYNREWRNSNKQKVYEYNLKHRKSNMVYYSYKQSLRYHQKNRATPPWLTDDQKKQIMDIYNLRDECRILTGDEYHVDHIVPIKGENVCGLHVPWNLQILPSDINLSKSNRFIGDMRIHQPRLYMQ